MRQSAFGAELRFLRGQTSQFERNAHLLTDRCNGSDAGVGVPGIVAEIERPQRLGRQRRARREALQIDTVEDDLDVLARDAMLK